MMGWLARASLIGIIIGAAAGFVAPKGATATNYSVHIQLWPEGGSDPTCGWHSGPCYDNDALVS